MQAGVRRWAARRAWRRRSGGPRALEQAQLALGEDALGAELSARSERGGGAAQPVVDRAGRDDGEGKPEAGVAQPGTGRAQQARLVAQEVEALEQAASMQAATRR